MKTPPSESPPERPLPERPLPERLTDAKARFISAAYAASPVRAVEKHPMASVLATTGAAFAVTVIAGQPVIAKVGGGFAKHGFGIVGALLKSPWFNAFLTPAAAGNPPVSAATTPS